MTQPISAPRGAPDILPPDSRLHEQVELGAIDLFRRHGFQRIETPAFEHTELFQRGLSEGSDIVTKEMYTFSDKGDRSLTLRPDMTAPVMRSVIEHNLAAKGLPLKLYYVVPVFRHERPQAGRYRQFTQLGVEAIGSSSPYLDAEVISLAAQVFDAAGIDEVTLKLNSIGHPGCRSEYLPKLVAFLEAHRELLCPDCQRKIEKNPLRTFDCKVPSDIEIMKQAPLISDLLCEACAAHHEAVKDTLAQLEVPFVDAPTLVRGLDYYSRTTFEFTASGLGSQDAIGGGGRYDGLSEMIGGPQMPGVGFGLGLARIVLALKAHGTVPASNVQVYLASFSPDAQRVARSLAKSLRRDGLAVDMDLDGRSGKAQFKAADRSGARLVVAIGDKELAEGIVTVKEMSSGQESTSPLEGLAHRLKELL